MKIINFFLTFLSLIIMLTSYVGASEFNDWVINFKKRAIKNDISPQTVNAIMDKAIFLPKVIKYDRYQPEFYEDTYTYIGKRVNEEKIKKGLVIYNNNIL